MGGGVRRPVCALFVGALAALLPAAFEPQSALPLAALFVLLCGGIWAFGGGRQSYAPWLLLGAALGGGFFFLTQRRIDALTARYDGQSVRIVASVEDVRPGYTRGTVRARLRVESADGEAVSFCSRSYELPLCGAGERIEGRFTLEGPAAAERPDAYADGILFYAAYEGGFARLGPQRGFRAWSARLQAKLSDALCRSLGADAAGALAAMIVGDRTCISSELNGAYRAAGLSHVLVVSGMHVSILCGLGLPEAVWDKRRRLDFGQRIAALLPGRVGRRLYRRLGLRRIRFELSKPRIARGGFHWDVIWRQRILALGPVLLAVLLAGVTGLTPSVLRAGVAVAISALGVWVMAPPDALTSLAIAGLILSAGNAYAACDVGFELSFAAVAGTLAGAELARCRRKKPEEAPEEFEEEEERPARRRKKSEESEEEKPPLLRRLLGRAAAGGWEAACISVCASAATFPVLVLRGMSASPYALLSGVAVLWLVQPIMLLGIAAALCGLLPFLWPLYRLCAFGAELLVGLLNGWARLVAGWPGAELYFDTAYAALLCLILMGLCLLAWNWRLGLRLVLPALLVVAVTGTALGVALQRDVVQVALVGGVRTPSAVLVQNGQAIVLYRGGSGGKAAVEDWLARRSIERAALLVDLRSDPSGADAPDAERQVAAARLADYTSYTARCGDIELELLRTGSGSGVRVTVDRWQLAAVSGDFALAQPVAVDYLLASPAWPGAFRWEGLLALSGGYSWMEADAAPAGTELLLRPGGGAAVR